MKIHTAYFLMILISCLSACELDDPAEGVSDADIIQWTESPAAIEADGKSRTTVSIRLGERAGANKEVTFTTDQGYFEGSKGSENPKEIKIKSSGKDAGVMLISDLIPNDEVGISASVGDFKIFNTVAFRSANPDVMSVTVDKLIVDADRTDFTTFTVELFREEGSGKVSNDLRLFIESTVTSGDIDVQVPVYGIVTNEKASFTVKSLNEEAGLVKIRITIESTTPDAPLEYETEIEFIE